MSELEDLARALRAQRPPIPPELLAAQRQRFLGDPRARVGAGGVFTRATPRVVLAFALASALLVAFMQWRAGSLRAPIAHDPPGAMEQRLNDGTLIRLDARARGAITDDGPREVRFELERGRAEFDVVPNPARTFRVIAGAAEVRVLGTRFSVDYEAEGKLRVAVEAGVVAVATAGAGSTRLERGDRFELNAGQVSVQRRQLELPAPHAPIAAEVSPSDSSPSARDAGSEHVVSDAPARSARIPAYRRLLASGDAEAALREARRRGLERVALELGPDELEQLADAARLGNDPDAALSLLRALERRFPRAEPAARASFIIGRLLSRRGQREEAIAAFVRYLERQPEGPHASDTLGRLMQAYAEGGDTASAAATAERYLRREPEGPYRRLALSLIATPLR